MVEPQGRRPIGRLDNMLSLRSRAARLHCIGPPQLEITQDIPRKLRAGAALPACVCGRADGGRKRFRFLRGLKEVALHTG